MHICLTLIHTQQRTAHLTYKLKDYLTLLKMFFSHMLILINFSSNFARWTPVMEHSSSLLSHLPSPLPLPLSIPVPIAAIPNISIAGGLQIASPHRACDHGSSSRLFAARSTGPVAAATQRPRRQQRAYPARYQVRTGGGRGDTSAVRALPLASAGKTKRMDDGSSLSYLLFLRNG